MYNFPTANCIYKEDILFENRDHLDFKMSCFPNGKQVLSKKIIKTKLLGTIKQSLNYCGHSHL